MKNQMKLSLYANTQLLKEKERKLLLLKVNKVGFNETKSSTPFMRTFECVKVENMSTAACICVFEFMYMYNL